MGLAGGGSSPSVAGCSFPAIPAPRANFASRDTRHGHAQDRHASMLNVAKSGRRKLFRGRPDIEISAFRRDTQKNSGAIRRKNHISLAPPADAREAAHLRSRPPPSRWFSRISLVRADDPLRGACIRRRRKPCAWCRRIDRAVGRYRRRDVGTQRRDTRGVADAAGIGERAGIGRAERHA